VTSHRPGPADESSPLIPDPGTRADQGAAAIELVARLIDARATRPIFTPPRDGLLDELRQPAPEVGVPIADLLARVEEAALAGWNKTDGGDLAYIPNGALYSGVLGALLAAGSHAFTGQSGEAPALVAIEESVIRWMAGLVGLPGGAGGILLSGGSLANQTAIATARARLGDDPSDGTLYVSERVHHSVVKAARLAGVPAARIRVVGADSDFRMDLASLTAAIDADRAQGLRPFLIVGVAGSTDTGAVDPLGAIADVASNAGAWLHVDAAYGGFLAMTERGHARLAGIEGADSVTLDAHKGLFLPYGIGALLVRDRARLLAAHAGTGAYLRDVAATDELPHYFELGPELTRPTRGLAVWLPLHLHGVAAFREALDRMLDLAEVAAERLDDVEGVEVIGRPALSIVAFRSTAGDAATDRILRAINGSGRFHVSSTTLDGRATIRLAFLNPSTTIEHVEGVVELIRVTSR
jgi:aromatic-L-amino-acid/L-tryptophan decarboxylase